jgi:hydroxypyruvate reductase
MSRSHLQGVVVTRYGHAAPCRHIQVLEAGHPVPDENSVAAARAVLQMVNGLSPGDTVLCLLSGGGSSLLCLPAEGITLADKQRLNESMLRAGMPIGAINTVRRHASAIKGGRLAAAAWPARVLTLVISDVPGDAPADIASGPTVADDTTCADALRALDRYGIASPAAVSGLLQSGASETCKPGNPRLARSELRMIATPAASLRAAAAVATAAGVEPVILGDHFEGEAAELGRAMAAQALEAASRRASTASPCVLLSGGETTVTVRGAGAGGRNVQFLLSMAIALDGAPDVNALAADTDGIDGTLPVAGAIIRPDTLHRAAAQGLDPRDFLVRNDAHSFFAALEDQVITGPTLTNVNDFRALLIHAN